MIIHSRRSSIGVLSTASDRAARQQTIAIRAYMLIFWPMQLAEQLVCVSARLYSSHHKFLNDYCRFLSTFVHICVVVRSIDRTLSGECRRCKLRAQRQRARGRWR